MLVRRNLELTAPFSKGDEVAMAGPFAHMTLVDKLCAEETDGIAGLTDSIRAALGEYMNFCELGAVSPDYPYLLPRASYS